MLFNSILAVAVFVGAVAAQNSSSIITVDPNTIDAGTRAAWCNGQISACSTLCSGNAPTNLCNSGTLSFSCLCTNGSSPDLKDYINTLPDYMCQASFAQCIAAHPNDLAGQTNCKSTILSQCGFLNLTSFSPVTTTSSTASSSSSTAAPSSSAPASATGGGSSTGSATAPSASASKTGAAMALSVGQSYGVGALAACAIAAFGYLL